MGQSTGYSEISGISGDHAVLRHELANVLNGLAGMTGLLKASGVAPEQQRWLDAIEQSVDQMKFLLTSRDCVAASAARAESSRFNGLQLLEQVLAACTPAAAAKGLRLLLVLSRDLPDRWRVNPRLLRQVLENLLGNAIKFTDSGDVVLSVRPAANRSLSLSVTDTGRGVPVADRARIFGARERGANVKGRPGAGLGLAVCSDIAGILGGTIACGRRGGGGAVFTVSLPEVLDRGDPIGLPSSALENVHCILNLDGDLRRSIGGFLDRLGVPWGDRTPGAGPAKLLLDVVENEWFSGSPWPGILLRPAGAAKACPIQKLGPPVTPYTLKQALLRQALAWRWSLVRPGGRRD